MKKIVIAGFVIAIVGVLGFAASGKISPLSWGLWGDVNLESGVGAGGYDVVSYHVNGSPTAGLPQYHSEYQGARWHFSNPGNKELFDTNPERFIPSYGGFCAYAIYKNVTADVNPTVWHIENETLYLFASEGPKRSWIAEISEGSIETADQNWAER